MRCHKNTFPSTTGSNRGTYSHLAIWNPWTGMAQHSMLCFFHIFSIIIISRCFVLILSVGPLRSSEVWETGGITGRKMMCCSKVTAVLSDMMVVSLAERWWIMYVGIVHHACKHEHSPKPTQVHTNSSRPANRNAKEEAWEVDKQHLDAAPWQCSCSRVTPYPWIFDEAWDDCCPPAALLSRFGPCGLFSC